MKLTRIDAAEALARVLEGKSVYMCIPIRGDTTIDQMRGAFAFAEEKEQEELPTEEPAEAVKPKAVKSKIDIGKINALYNAGWSVRQIVDEMHISEPTVRKYIQKED